MRRYDIVSGILVILSIIDFALAAPATVSVQEKRQACVDGVHIPKDVVTVLGKRWEEGLEKLWEDYSDELGRLEESGNLESPATHSESSSSSSLSEPDHGSTNVGQVPAPNPTPNPTPNPMSNPTPNPTPNPASPTANPWDGVWSYKVNDGLHGPLYTPTSSAYASSGYGSDQEFAKAHEPQPNPNSRPSLEPDSSTGPPDFDWKYWMHSEDPPPPRPASSNDFGQAHEYQVDHINPPSTSGYAPSPTEPENEVVTPPSPNLGSPKSHR